MAFMSAMGECVGCGQVFSFNPQRVPSMRVSRADGKWVPDQNGQREPVCANCVARYNVIREKMHLPLISVLPGAYDAEEIA